MFADRIQTLLPSPTIAIDTKAKALKQQGIPVINLSAGEPDFDTPEHIKTAAKQALDAGFTKYSAPQGLPELRELVAHKFAKENNIAYDPSQIVIGAGSKQLLYAAFQLLCNPGDEVLVPIPSWSTFAEQIKLAGGKPVFVPLSPPFKVTVNDLEKKRTAKTKLLLLNSPSNPTGAMIDPEELEKIAAFAVTHNIFVIADEIYEKLIYSERHVSIASLNNEIKKQTITMNGVSKSYAMTGWRLGFAGGPEEVMKKMTALQSQTIGNVPAFVQKAGIEALTGDQNAVQTMQQAYEKRRAYLIDALSSIPEFTITKPEGAFYFFVSLERILGKKYTTAQQWCEALLEKKHVALVPGEAFFAPGYFRLSFAASMNDLQEAVERIKKFIYET